MSIRPALNMHETAEAVGYAYNTFRQRWRELPGFPSPIIGHKWDPTAVEGWRAARSRVLIDKPASPTGASDQDFDDDAIARIMAE
ncbi:MAG TPA: hypothetical protein VGF33_03060 [Caulobacteraceae bacterium]|jgi:hypothetical protein